MEVGDRLRAWREAQGLSQAEAAKLAEISQAAWCFYERGDRIPRADAMLKICALTAKAKKPEHRITSEMFAAAERARTAAA